MSALASTADPFTLAAAQLAPLSRLKAEPDWLRADFRSVGKPLDIDRKKGIIYGRVLAEKGQFKSAGRGEFDDQSLDMLAQLAAEHPNGLKARFAHPGLSADGLGKFLGRDHNLRRDGDKFRGDLHFNPTALDTPPQGGKPLGIYVMDLVASDRHAVGSSLVLRANKEYRLNDDGERTLGADGEPLPPLWRPTKLHACDVVDDGDAVHGGFLSSDLPDSVVRQVWAALDSQFSGCDRQTIESRGRAFLDRYLDLKFEGDMNAATPPAPAPTPSTPPNPAPNPQPPGRPAPAPPPPPQPPASPAGELAAERAELERLAAEVKANLETARAEQKKALAAAKQARVDDFLDSRKRAGKISPAELDESNPATAHLSLRQRLLRLPADATVPVGDELQSPLDIELAAIDARPVRPHGPRLEGYHGEGHEQPLAADRRRTLLSHTTAGRAILREEQRR